MIGNSSICDVEKKVCKKDSGVKRKGRKKDNNKDKDKDNLIYKLLNNKDKLHNFSDKVLNSLINIVKLKEKTLINKKKIEEINVPIQDIRSNLDKYKELKILCDDLINHVWRMIYGKNRVNIEIDHFDCNIVEDAKTYLTKYIKIVSHKQVLIYSVSESIDELMEGLDVNSSNDIVAKEIKDFKRVLIESIDKFKSCIKLKLKRKIPQRNILKRYKNSVEHDANSKQTANANIKVHIKEKQKIIKQRYKSLLDTKKNIKNNTELIYSALKRLPKESHPKLIELIRLDTISNDLINVIWREIYDRERKSFKKIDGNKIKNVDVFIDHLINIINSETALLKTTVIIKLNSIISDLKVTSEMDDVYNFNDKDKLS